jgi:Carboxypeptidase regulatory-like domain
MEPLFDIAAKISGPWSLAAFGIAAIVYIVLKKRGKVSRFGWVCILFFVLAPILSAAYVQIFRIKSESASLYRVRVTVLGVNQIPVEDASVWSSIGGEPKKVSGGWEFDIPTALKPVNKPVKVYAAIPAEFLTGESDVTLDADYNPTAIVTLGKKRGASVHGVVTDASGRGVEGARVMVVGASPVFETKPDGHFTLSADAADGEEVLLSVTKDGFKSVQQLHPAGNEPAAIVLYPEAK